MDIEHMILLKKLYYAKTLNIKPNQAIKNIIHDNGENSWITQTKQNMLEIGLDYDTLQDQENRHTHRINKQAVTAHMKKNIESKGLRKTKYQFLNKNKMNTQTDYLYKLTRRQARAIFMARSRMLKTKTYYKNMHKDIVCRGCSQKDETQKHILEECPAIHKDPEVKTTTEHLFKTYCKQTKQTAKNIIQVQNIIRQWE